MKIIEWVLDHAFLNFEEERLRKELKILELSRRQVAIILLFFGTITVAVCCLGCIMGFNYANTRCMVFYQNMRIIENYNYTCGMGGFGLSDVFRTSNYTTQGYLNNSINDTLRGKVSGFESANL